MKNRPHSFFIFMVAAVASAAFTYPAHAGRYELAKQMYQQDRALCKAYEKNLNSFPNNKHPMVCERPINPKFKDFSKPEWKDLDPLKHQDLIIKMHWAVFAYGGGTPKPTLADFTATWDKEEFKKKVMEHRFRLRLALLDIVNANGSVSSPPDGIPDFVLQYYSDTCDPTQERFLKNSSSTRYFITNEALTEVKEFRTLDPNKDVFLYRGEVYFDSFRNLYSFEHDQRNDDILTPQGVERHEFYIHSPIGNGVARVCRYRYIE